LTFFSERQVIDMISDVCHDVTVSIGLLYNVFTD